MFLRVPENGLSALWRSVFITGLKKLSALTRCPLYTVRFREVFLYEFIRKPAGPKIFVRLNKVSALEGVRFNQVLLYSVSSRIETYP